MTTSKWDLADLHEYTIVPVIERQRQQLARMAFVPWARGASFERFLELAMKERKEGEWAQDSRLMDWGLVKRDDLEGELYASCETYRRTAIIRHRDSKKVEETHMYGIASVVTPVNHLRKGYASRLLRLLHYHLADNGLIPPFPAQWGAPPPSLPPTIASALPKAIGSSLWSDVGSTFYSRCTVGPDRPGWVVHDHMCQELTWKILPPSDDADRKPCKWIYQSDLPEIGKILSAAARTRLQAGETVPKTFFQQDPTSKGILSFVPVRGSYSEGFAEPHEPSGVRMALPNGEETIILFTAYNTSIAPRLLITCIHNLHLEHLPSLLRLLDTVGSGAGRTEGWVWDLDPSSELVKAWQAMPEREVRASRRAERMGHLLGVAWYGAEEEMENAEFVDRQMWNWC